jgi:hypothetical protein
MYSLSLGKDHTQFPCVKGSPVGDYQSGYCFTIEAGPEHDLLLRKLVFTIQSENEKEPGKHRAEIITVYEESFLLGYEDREAAVILEKKGKKK